MGETMENLNDLPHGWLELTDSQYDAIPALRCTELKHFCRSPAHYQAYLQEPKETTSALRWGQIVHCCLLQPNDFARRVVIEPKCDKRTKEGKELYAQFSASLAPDSLTISHEESLQLSNIRDAYMKYFRETLSQRYDFSNPAFEIPGFARLQDVFCKVKPDISCQRNGGKVILDIKTTEDASESAFVRAIFNYGYHIQAAFYSLVAEEIDFFPVDEFVFIAIEKKAPYAIREFKLSTEALNYGKSIVRVNLARFKTCMALNQWEAYPATQALVNTPAWLINEPMF